MIDVVWCPGLVWRFQALAQARVQQEAAGVARHVDMEALVSAFLACGPPSLLSACMTPPLSSWFAPNS